MVVTRVISNLGVVSAGVVIMVVADDPFLSLEVLLICTVPSWCNGPMPSTPIVNSIRIVGHSF